MTTVSVLFGIFLVVLAICVPQNAEVILDCYKELRMGQFMCPDPNVIHIDSKTQQPFDCTKDNIALVWCVAADGIICTETKNSSFLGEIPCQWT